MSDQLKNVKIGNGDAVHAAYTEIWNGDVFYKGARCNRNWSGPHRTFQVRTTTFPITCVKCQKITQAATAT